MKNCHTCAMSWIESRRMPGVPPERTRVRYLPTSAEENRIGGDLDALTTTRHITGWTEIIYEPEVHAFGGAQSMASAHRLFHRDPRNLAGQLHSHARGHRRETSLMLCSLLTRTAGLDWYEQGDVWARVSAHRPPPAARRHRPGPS
ncbi:thiopeptide-type bacteriocin biosynthesis protein [Streptomyces sp. NPDC048202]|uniref:thiopeptide-type bacteriocin biosynthesis protein n=1 Tax=Streptomyces sp. NPDC048202 TaxID=3365514 RepID=UPI0037192F4F